MGCFDFVDGDLGQQMFLDMCAMWVCVACSNIGNHHGEVILEDLYDCHFQDPFLGPCLGGFRDRFGTQRKVKNPICLGCVWVNFWIPFVSIICSVFGVHFSDVSESSFAYISNWYADTLVVFLGIGSPWASRGGVRKEISKRLCFQYCFLLVGWGASDDEGRGTKPNIAGILATTTLTQGRVDT